MYSNLNVLLSFLNTERFLTFMHYMQTSLKFMTSLRSEGPLLSFGCSDFTAMSALRGILNLCRYSVCIRYSNTVVKVIVLTYHSRFHMPQAKYAVKIYF